MIRIELCRACMKLYLSGAFESLCPFCANQTLLLVGPSESSFDVSMSGPWGVKMALHPKGKVVIERKC